MWLLPLLLVLTGCGVGFGNAAPHSEPRLFITQGMHTGKPGTHAIIYGPRMNRDFWSHVTLPDEDAESIVEHAIALWLQRQGWVIVGPGRAAVQKEQVFHLTNLDRIRIGRMTGADVVVLRSYSRTLGTVSVEGVHVESGEVLWSGASSVVQTDAERQHGIDGRTLRALTCQALAAAFRLRPPGAHHLDPNTACAF